MRVKESDSLRGLACLIVVYIFSKVKGGGDRSYLCRSIYFNFLSVCLEKNGKFFSKKLL